MKTLVGVSGGVDSSVALLLLKDKYEVEGLNLLLTDINDVSVSAKEVCDKLNIKFNLLDLRDRFNKCVIKNFIDEYNLSNTPNPCIECNKHIKFGDMIKYAKENNFDFIATGHYAKIEYSDKYKRKVIKIANNKLKDQSYFLYTIKSEDLDYILFPLGEFNTKEEIRQIAKNNNLSVYSKSDSQDICFIKDDYKTFLEENGIKPIEGNVLYKNKIIGTHNGLYRYTIGQRKGLGIACENPIYVIGFDKENNNLLMGDESDLYKKEFTLKNVNLQAIDKIEDKIDVNIKIRYKSKLVKGTIYYKDGIYKVILDEAVKSITKGQSAVFYDDDILIGGGIIGG